MSGVAHLLLTACHLLQALYENLNLARALALLRSAGWSDNELMGLGFSEVGSR